MTRRLIGPDHWFTAIRFLEFFILSAAIALPLMSTMPDHSGWTIALFIGIAKLVFLVVWDRESEFQILLYTMLGMIMIVFALEIFYAFVRENWNYIGPTRPVGMILLGDASMPRWGFQLLIISTLIRVSGLSWFVVRRSPPIRILLVMSVIAIAASPLLSFYLFATSRIYGFTTHL